MNIALLSHPLKDNYGGILQAWALKTVLSRSGHKVEVLGLRNTQWRRYLLPLIWFKRIIYRIAGKNKSPIFSEIKEVKTRKRLYKGIDKFKASQLPTYLLKSLTQIPERRFDAIIVGSDQVWRKEYIDYLWKCKDYPAAFLHGVSNSIIKIAYAASFGVEKWEYTPDHTEKIHTALKNYKAISVREASAVDLLKDFVGIDSEWVLDPTMLLSAEEYRKLLSLPAKKTAGGPTVVSYILDTTREKCNLINQVVKAFGGNHFELNITDPDVPRTSVVDWVSSISNADIVVTDSFHGCVFSIIFRRRLVFVMNSERGNTRFNSLIQMFGITDNLVSPESPFNPYKDYHLPQDIDTIITKYQEKSMNLLFNALE